MSALVGCAGKLGLGRKDRPSGGLARAASSRKTARSDYEQAQIVLQLQAVERMKEMVQVRAHSQVFLRPSLPLCFASQSLTTSHADWTPYHHSQESGNKGFKQTTMPAKTTSPCLESLQREMSLASFDSGV